MDRTRNSQCILLTAFAEWIYFGTTQIGRMCKSWKSQDGLKRYLTALSTIPNLIASDWDREREMWKETFKFCIYAAENHSAVQVTQP